MVGRRVLRYRMPLPLKLFLGLAGVCCLSPLVVLLSHPDKAWSVLQIIALGAVLMTTVYVGHAGYRIGYDDARLYMRGPNPWNRRLRWPTHSIALGDIAQIDVHASMGAPPASRQVAGEYLSVVSTRVEDQEIRIRPDALHEDDLVELLVWLKRHRPDTMPKSVLDRLPEAGCPV